MQTKAKYGKPMVAVILISIILMLSNCYSFPTPPSTFENGELATETESPHGHGHFPDNTEGGGAVPATADKQAVPVATSTDVNPTNLPGGIDLSPDVEFTDDLGNITGAVYDPEKQLVVLLSDDESSGGSGLSIKAEDFAVALKLIYGDYPQEPKFTLDPYDPANPRGEWLKAVYIPDEILAGTSFGKSLFDADWLLKQYSFGVRVDENGVVSDRACKVPGFKSISDIMFEHPDSNNGEETWSRFWITPDVVKLKGTGNIVEFDTVTMRVNAKKIVPDPSSPQGFKDVDANDPISVEFAETFTKLYDQLAQESPEFERVRDLTKAMALAKWMKSRNIPIDMGWVDKYAAKNADTIDKVKTLSVSREKTYENDNSSLTVYVFGGVDLTIKPDYEQGNAALSSLEQDVCAKLDGAGAQPVFTVSDNGKQITATVIPLNGGGQALY